MKKGMWTKLKGPWKEGCSAYIILDPEYKEKYKSIGPKKSKNLEKKWAKYFHASLIEKRSWMCKIRIKTCSIMQTIREIQKMSYTFKAIRLAKILIFGQECGKVWILTSYLMTI